MCMTQRFRIMAGLLAMLLLLTGALTACGETHEGSADTDAPTEGATGTTSESETLDAAQSALEAIGEINYGGRELTVLCQEDFVSEVSAINGTVAADGGVAQVINDAVYDRNSLLEDHCKLSFQMVKTDAVDINTRVRNEASVGQQDFQLINCYIVTNAGLATENVLGNYNRLSVDISGEWWDRGTADFILKGGVYFMTGSLNFCDDDKTILTIFNKDLQNTYANTVPNPYETVRSWEWTLEHFNTVIQGISKENGDGVWDEKDTYGFAAPGEAGTIFFYAADLFFVQQDASVDEPTLYLADSSRMERAINNINLSRRIHHDNHATFMTKPYEEVQSYQAFIENRALFTVDYCLQIGNLAAEMDAEYGVLPMPKYDKAQEVYRTVTHAAGSSVAIPTTIPEADLEVVGDILEAYAILSHQQVRPVYYDTIVTSRNIRDADSAEMLDIIFQNRVYDMAVYFDLGMNMLVADCVRDNTDSFQSTYKRAASTFDKRLNKLLKKLDDAT